MRDYPEIDAAIAALGLTMRAKFVPFSRSRNINSGDGGKPWRSLNWRVTLVRNGRDVLTTDYSAGEGHCPSRNVADRYERERRVAFECENGFAWNGRKRIEPNMREVLYSLVMDASVIESGGFEDWAADCGYDADSRKAEATYRACLDIALQLRAAIGEAGLASLREAFQDY